MPRGSSGSKRREVFFLFNIAASLREQVAHCSGFTLRGRVAPGWAVQAITPTGEMNACIIAGARWPARCRIQFPICREDCLSAADPPWRAAWWRCPKTKCPVRKKAGKFAAGDWILRTRGKTALKIFFLALLTLKMDVRTLNRRVLPAVFASDLEVVHRTSRRAP